MLDFVLSLMVLATIALLVGAFLLWRRTGNTRQALLMVVLALVAVVNIAIWTVPDDEGRAPIDQVPEGTD